MLMSGLRVGIQAQQIPTFTSTHDQIAMSRLSSVRVKDQSADSSKRWKSIEQESPTSYVRRY